MKLYYSLLGALLIPALPIGAFGVDSASEVQSPAHDEQREEYRKSEAAYRESLEKHDKDEATYRKYENTRVLVIISLVAGVVAFMWVPIRRMSRRSLEFNERQQQTLEEIRDLLKKR